MVEWLERLSHGAGRGKGWGWVRGGGAIELGVGQLATG